MQIDPGHHPYPYGGAFWYGGSGIDPGHRHPQRNRFLSPAQKENRLNLTIYAVSFGAASQICLHFAPPEQNYGSPPSSRRRQQSTGLLHFDGSNLPAQIKIPKPNGFGIFMGVLNLMTRINVPEN